MKSLKQEIAYLKSFGYNEINLKIFFSMQEEMTRKDKEVFEINEKHKEALIKQKQFYESYNQGFVRIFEIESKYNKLIFNQW